MNSRRRHIFLFITIATLLGIWSCTDESLFRKDYVENVPDNAVGFEVSSGFGANSGMTRSEDVSEEETDLEPILFSDDVDSLYIHRYVAPEIERATGRGPYSNTRSTPVNSINSFYDLNKVEGFKVVAMNTDNWPDSEYFGWSIAKPLSGSQVKWYVSPYKYWPGNKELCFNAYAPSSAEFNNSPTFGKDEATEEDVITFAYTVPKSEGHKSDATEQPDLMFATTIHSHYKSDGSHQGDLAPLNFRHALSSIKFAVGDVANITITNITIKGVSGSGKCVYFMNRNAINDSGNNDQNDGEDTDNTIFYWNDLSDPTDNYYCQTFDYQNSDPYPDKPNKDTSTVINDQEDYKDKTFMLIPQEIPEAAVLEVGIKYLKDDVVVEKTLKGKLKTEDIPLWEPGKEYIYTISTSSENWQYVFEVIGSYQKPKTFDDETHEYNYGEFVDNPQKIEIDASVTVGSYYKVRSYRYRTNNPNKYELLPWTAVATEGNNTVPEQFSEFKDRIPMTVNRENWLLGTNWKYEDEGSDTLKLFKNLSFAPQYIATDYYGDWAMRAKGEKYGSESAPVDLSLVDGSLNTANCYVVNAGGWYSIPLYYGCSMKKGKDISTTYNNMDYTVTHTDNAGVTSSWAPLAKYLDYKGNPIESGEIKTPVKDAILVWQDAYGIIDTCRYDENKNQIFFHVDPTYLQQANCVLAIRDSEKDIIWSWHIWVTDHWVNDNDLKLGVGDVECEAENPDKGPFDFAPYNLGWCDPKNVLYLKRSGKMTFTQTASDKTTVLDKKTLDIIQRPDEIEFWIGNSTYYQFGRKDPIVGFINNKNQEKYHYGEMPYTVIDKGNLQDCILYPNAFFIANEGLSKYYNLWNNYNSDNITTSGTIDTPVPKNPNLPATGENLLITVTSGNPNLSTDFAYSANKTIYDPSPVGYVVPPVDFFKIFGIGNPNSGDLSQYVGPNFFRGDSIAFSNYPNYFNYVIKPDQNSYIKNTVTFNVNGQRRYWYLNMNPCLVYLWSNTNGFYNDWSGSLAAGFALGYDTNGDFTLNSYFQGSKLIARPVRCIKESTQ